MLKIAMLVSLFGALGACGGSSSMDGDRAAILAVIERGGGIPSYVGTAKIGEHDCQIDHGGPPILDYEPFAGRCRWEVENGEHAQIVTFSQLWPCGATGSEQCEHWWRYAVGASNGVTFVEEGGPTPPQLWQ